MTFLQFKVHECWICKRSLKTWNAQYILRHHSDNFFAAKPVFFLGRALNFPELAADFYNFPKMDEIWFENYFFITGLIFLVLYLQSTSAQEQEVPKNTSAVQKKRSNYLNVSFLTNLITWPNKRQCVSVLSTNVKMWNCCQLLWLRLKRYIWV